MIESIVKRNLIKYAVGRQIFCAKCNAILDYRRAVVWHSPMGRSGCTCAQCWRDGLAQIHDDNPHQYLLSIGWQVDTLVNFDAKPKVAKPELQEKPGKALDKALRKTIFRAFKASGYCTKTDRVFPNESTCWKYDNPPLLEVVEPDGTVTIGYTRNAEYSAYQVAEYVRAYCEANHLTQ